MPNIDKYKICIQCEKPFKVRQSQRAKIFCTDKCKNLAYKELEESHEYLKRTKLLLCEQYEVLEMKKHILIIKEGTGLHL